MSDGLVLEDLELCLEKQSLFKLSCAVAPGEILSVLGPSGSGKSSLLAAIAGSLAPEFRLSGRIALDGAALNGLPPHRRRVGLLFQDPLLFPHLSVGENLAFGLARRHKDRRARAEAALAEIGLEGFFSRDPATLSGGQAARVALQRALLSEPAALLLDEPFSKLDAGLRASSRQRSFETIRARRIPALIVTHDAEDAAAAGGRTLILGDQPSLSSGSK